MIVGGSIDNPETRTSTQPKPTQLSRSFISKAQQMLEK